ncbi:MAG: CDP-alcohol phosphatidyltransferase family protein [Gemmatimonadota bacterium]|nr:CDP-alcohol phosphatidyltransferase family protein [Gemmatimonadota bacterium]
MANEVIEHSGGQVVSFNMAYKSRIFSPPNLISAIRVVTIPFIYWCMKRSSDHLALLLIGLALVSDAADGYFARRFRWQSDWGLIIDPLADKLMIGSLSVFLVIFREFPVWMAALIVGRDVAIVVVGIFLFLKPMRLVVPSNKTGKLATAVTSIALLNYLLEMQTYGLWFLWIALCLIIGSSIHYAWNFYLLVNHSPGIIQGKDGKVAAPPGSALQQRTGSGT